MPSVLNSVLSGIQTAIQGAGTGIANGSIVIRKVDSFRDLSYPAIVISAQGYERIPVSNARDQVTYRVKVSVVKAGNENLATTPDAVPAIMEAICRALAEERLSGVTESVRTTLGPVRLFPTTDFKSGEEAGYVVVNAICWETR